ncbi:MAG TPA: hypothetical protein DEG76_05335 [Pseudohongiella sp.]|nr:hypothetical protein [Pseudohongiella sp.]HBX36734.1 hypothetical protein [Pseudohongiella sp.]|tara:strand:+ start:1569 stop:2327 length:759 start_codon:yes stop_codon:yes gene_type:complete
MRKATGLFLGLLICGISPAALSNNTGEITIPDDVWAVGTARTPDGSEIQYYELHFSDADRELTTRVEYRYPDGELFAEKQLSYQEPLASPGLNQQDLRNNARIQINRLESGDEVAVEVNYRSHDAEQAEQVRISSDDDLIIDAGFDVFIRQNWESLVQGERITADFLVPARLDKVRIGISRTDADDCATLEDEIHCFLIRPAGFLRVVSWFVDPIAIGYDPQTKRLRVFNGISNLRDEQGEARNALITFEYY